MCRGNKMRVLSTPHFVTQRICYLMKNISVIQNDVISKDTCDHLFKTKEKIGSLLPKSSFKHLKQGIQEFPDITRMCWFQLTRPQTTSVSFVGYTILTL